MKISKILFVLLLILPSVSNADVICKRNGALKIFGVSRCPRGHSKVNLSEFIQPEKGDKGDKGDTGAAGADGAQGQKGDKGDTGEGVLDSNIVTLYTRDFIARDYDFGRRTYGSCFGNVAPNNIDGVYNCGVDIRLSGVSPNYSFEVGVEGNDQGRIIDLGSVSDLETAYSGDYPNGAMYEDLWFSTLHVNDSNQAGFAYNNGANILPLSESNNNSLFSIAPGTNFATITAGHYYILRITNSYGKDLIVRLFVSSYDAANGKIVFRYTVLRNTEEVV